MSERTFDNFDQHVSQYRKIHTQNVKISGADSFYFAMHKAELLKNGEADAELDLLDIGCGDGAVEIFLEKKFNHLKATGIDVSSESIAMAKSHGLLRSEFMSYDGKRLPFTDERFDIVFVAAVLHHVAFPLHPEFLSEAFRVLKPGGRIYIFEHNPFNPATRYLVRTCAFDKDARLLKAGYAADLLRKSGFVNVQKRYILFFPRMKWLGFLMKLEPALSKFPLGAQYMLRAVK